MDHRLNLPLAEPVVSTALELLDGVGPATVAALRAAYATVGEMLDGAEAHAAAGTAPPGLKRPVVAALADGRTLLSLVDRVESDFEATVEAGGEILHPGDPAYPSTTGSGPQPVLRIFGEPLPPGPLCGLFGAHSNSGFGRAAAARIAAALHGAGVATATAGDGPVDGACVAEAVRTGGRHVAVLDRGWTPDLRRTGSMWAAVLDGGGTLVGRFGHGTPHSHTSSLEAGDTLVRLSRAMVAVRGSDGNAVRKTVSRTLSAGMPLLLVVPPEKFMERSDEDFIAWAAGHRNAGDLVRTLNGREDYPRMLEVLLGAGGPEPETSPPGP